jgi:hypothetical protein
MNQTFKTCLTGVIFGASMWVLVLAGTHRGNASLFYTLLLVGCGLTMGTSYIHWRQK